MKSLIVLLIIFLISVPAKAKTPSKNAIIDDISDLKDFKKILRTKTNVLVCYINSLRECIDILKVFKETAEIVKGLGTLLLINCSGEAKKICKKFKVNPNKYVLKHYKDGEFNKDYDRRDTVASMANFMRDPTGDLPWEEDPLATNVHHIPDAISLAKFIRRETKPIMIMFYAPWCSFCKTLKPEFAEAANDLKDHAHLAAIDVNRPENSAIRTQYNITGFPTLLYYEHGVMKLTYEGDNNRQAIVEFMRNPHSPPPTKVNEPDWSEADNEIVHLTASNFDPVIKEEASVLVMFYAPWCGHCKRMKSEYEKAAILLKNEGINGILAAVDATREQSLAARFDVKGYPTVKYFSYGEPKFDVPVRETPQLIAFMRRPDGQPTPPPPERHWSEEESYVVHLNEESFKPFLKKKKHVLVMFYTPWCGHCKKAKPEFAKAAEVFKDDSRVEFAAVDCTAYSGLCSANGVKGYPTIKYFSYYKSVKSYSGARTEADFVSYMSNPDSKPPESPKPKPSDLPDDRNPVMNLTDDTFKNHISTNEPVLVMFYAPWCGHCLKMKPEYAKAANELSAEGYEGKFALFDCTENPEITEEYEVSGFPTIKLFRNGKFIEDYKGKRTLEEIKHFMKISATKTPKEEL